MPTVHVHINKEQTPEEKLRFAQLLTEAVCEPIGKKPTDVTLYFYYHTGGTLDMAFAGELVSDNP